MANGSCRLAVDIGGTFTDVVLETPEALSTTKVLTTPRAPERGVMQGIGKVLEDAGRQPADVRILIHGTTLATNALIERKGAKTAFLTTEGFRDILEMGFEKRFAHYDLTAKRPDPLVPRGLRYTVSERKSATGQTVTPLAANAVREAAAAMRAAAVEAVAVGFLHAYAHPEHEQAVAAILAEELPDTTVCLSSEVCPEMREYERFSTTCANAYVRPLMAGYLGRLRTMLDDGGFACPLFLMMSGGGLTTLDQAARFPIRLVESGPAGGAILAAELARARGLHQVLSYDMGGTTAKICLIRNGSPDRSRSFEVARVHRDMKGSGLPVRVPVIEMVEIGAGGGSIARIDAMKRITVGPDSAGSEPGPAAYGRGGTSPTVTDANLILGKLDPQRFAGGQIKLDLEGATRALDRTIGAPLALEDHWPAAGVAEMVEENMANAARVHAIERGKEAAEHTMIAFGGGAPLHAARLAEKLGMTRVVVPPGAGVGSAIGFLKAPVSYQVVRSYRTTLDEAELAEVNRLVAEMAAEARAVVAAGAGEAPLTEERQLELRYLGQGHELPVPLPERLLEQSDLTAIRREFETLYLRVYGLTMPDVAVECVSWSVTVATRPEPTESLITMEEHAAQPTDGTRRIYDPAAGGLVEAGLYWRFDLLPGATLTGPAVIAEDETSTVVPTGFAAVIDGGGAIVMTRNGAETTP